MAKFFSSIPVRLVLIVLAVMVLGEVARSLELSSPRAVRIGIVLLGNARQPQVNGFIAGMTALGYVGKHRVHYLIRNAHNDRTRLRALVSALVDARVDLLVAAGGLEADSMRPIAVPRHIPVVVLFVSSIVERGLVDSRRHPGWAVTGVDNLNAELSGKRVALLQDLLRGHRPPLHRILILYYTHIAPSRIGVEVAKATALRRNLVIDAQAVDSPATIRRAMNALHPGEVDAMLTVPNAPIDDVMHSIILPRVKVLGLPLMTYARTFVKQGALASYGASLYAMGHQAARLADKVLHGIPAQNIPFETPMRIVYTLNKGTMARLGIHLSPLVRNQVDQMIGTGH